MSLYSFFCFSYSNKLHFNFKSFWPLFRGEDLLV